MAEERLAITSAECSNRCRLGPLKKRISQAGTLRDLAHSRIARAASRSDLVARFRPGAFTKTLAMLWVLRFFVFNRRRVASDLDIPCPAIKASSVASLGEMSVMLNFSVAGTRTFGQTKCTPDSTG